MKHAPPRWADKFLEWYCRHDLLEEIRGDVYELYQRTARDNKRRADLHFVWNVIRFFRFRNIRKRDKRQFNQNFSAAMLRSYLRSGLRNISRQATHSVINIAGLSIAIACCISVFLLSDSFHHLDNFHSKGDRTYLLVSNVKADDDTQRWARTPHLLGQALKEEHSAVETVVRIQQMSELSVRYQQHVFREAIWSVDSTFLDVFNYPVVQGSENALADKKSIVISTEKAIQYFGTDNAIGKELSVKFSPDKTVLFEVGAVIDNLQDKSSMHVDFLIPMSYWEEDYGIGDIDWATWTRSTFVVLKEDETPSALQPAMVSYQKLQNQANEKFPVRNVTWVPLTELATQSYSIDACLSRDIHPAILVTISVIVVFLLVLACFNYMNVAIASVSLRLKEIGIRKVIGGSKAQVILQYMVENFVLCALALVAGTFIAYIFLVPAFNVLYPLQVPFTFSSVGALVGFFGGVLFVIVLLSGAYPSFYVSSFNAVNILKGQERFGGKNLFSKLMLGLQFGIAFTTIIFSLLSITNRDYFEKKDWGYHYQDVLYMPIQGKEQFMALKELMSRQKNVVRYGGTQSHIGHTEELTSIQAHGRDMQVNRFPVGYDYVEAMNLRLKEGRSFTESTASDRHHAVVVNETLVKNMGWTDPLNQSLTFHGNKYFVIGVVQDFYYEDFETSMEPALLHIVPEEEFRYFVVQASPGAGAEVVEQIRKSWTQIAPDDAYLGSQQLEVFGSFYRDNRSGGKVMYFISIVALLLSCMGLFGLISHNLSRRLKEFSIRKIFGAGILHIFKLMGRVYIVVISVAFIVGSMLGYYLMVRMNATVKREHIPLTFWPVIVTGIIMLLAIAITIASQLHRVVRENPAATLRSN
jgi:ABC-type antimicrobial peptide transport system permease subunit